MVLIAVVTIAFIACVASRAGVDFYSTDTAQYVSSARELTRGHGFGTQALYYEPQISIGVGARQTVWPPGYPALIAAASLLTGADAIAIPRYTAPLGHALTALLLTAIVLALGRLRSLAVALGLCYLALSAVWINSAGGLSEGFYIVMTVAAILCAVRASDGSPAGRRWLWACSFFVAAAFLMRYVGISLIGAFGLLLAIRWWRERTALRALEYMLAGAIPAIAMLAVFGRNYAIAGSIVGGSNEPANSSVIIGLKSLAWSSYTLMGLPSGALGALGIVGFAAALRYVGRGVDDGAEDAARPGARYSIDAAVFVAAYVFFFCALMVWLSAASPGYALNVRYVLPMVVPAVVLVLLSKATPSARPSSSSRVLRSVVGVCALAGFALLQARQWREDASWWPTQQNERAGAIRRVLEQPVGRGTVRSELLALSASYPALISHDGPLVAMFLDKPVLGLPGLFYTRRVWDVAELRRDAQRLNSPLLCVFDRDPAAAVALNPNSVVLHQLATGVVPDGLVVMARWPGVTLYRIAL